MPLSIAIIGSGPAGFYTADALMRACPECEIDFVERLPTPYGLIRGGVAPDHQTTKKIAKKYERTALTDHVNFYGNVELNRDISLAELSEIYDAVVLAVGAPMDKKLTLPGSDKYGVVGSAAFVGWYNGHPDFRELDPGLDIDAAAVIGNGNVAMDVGRVLLRSPEGLAKSDVPEHVAARISSSPIKDVYMFGRRGPVDAKFTNVELKEIRKLNYTIPMVRAEQLPEDDQAALGDLEGRERRFRERNLQTLREYSEFTGTEKPKRIHFEFYASPVEILGGERVEGLRLEKTRVVEGRAEGTGETFDVKCGLVVAAIGYRSDPIEGAPYDEARGIIPNDNGRVREGLYAVGWIKRGPSGVISSNRPDGEIVAGLIHDDFQGGHTVKPGRAGLEKFLNERNVRWVSFADWQKLEALELENAEGPAPRKKFVTVEEMLAAING
jgi:NADPH-dependent glutamate synthase beta subunit-like oxidoreductase